MTDMPSNIPPSARPWFDLGMNIGRELGFNDGVRAKVTRLMADIESLPTRCDDGDMIFEIDD